MARRVSGLIILFVTAPLFAQSISPDALRAHVTYLASDELEGRSTPSPGLDAAADYIAAQFKAASLETSFQTAPYYEKIARNVVGILRGSDEALRETYVIVSAHYDHLGPANKGKDRIYNGANDNASGVASLIELAHVLKPQRSILFIAYFGEEVGEIGSFYYAEHPLVPVATTIAQVNLEQLGRPSKRKRALITGFGLSTLPDAFIKTTGVEFKDGGMQYFAHSDNFALAYAGVPAHTISAGFSFREYHTVSDSADKLDYANMAAVSEGIAVGLRKLASGEAPPTWKEGAGQKIRTAPRK